MVIGKRKKAPPLRRGLYSSLFKCLCATHFGKLSKFAKVFLPPIQNSKFTIQNSKISSLQKKSLKNLQIKKIVVLLHDIF